MSTFLIVANIVFFAVAFYINARQVKRTNVRMWLRIPAAFISAYICIVYMLALIGILPQEDIRYFMRWFQLVISAYIIVEGLNG